MILRVRIVIRGAVQGVGFRPFVYRLATSLGLAGWVSNSSEGVFIEAEGTIERLERFITLIDIERPARSSIQSLEYSFADAVGFSDFQIRPSETSGLKTAVVLPDIATCRDCLSEILDPANRRFQYPFTNCTNCGPRFTIIEGLPYDRAKTSMRAFEICADCRREYEDPADRRFHAQPNACPACGPHLELWNSDGRTVASRGEAFGAAVEVLKNGRILAVKGLGGFHLMTGASDEASVMRLRERKHREEKPFALMASLECARRCCDLSPLEERALCSPEAPIVIARRNSSSEVAASVAPRNPYLGVMLPYTPLHHLLTRAFDAPLVATSGNRSDEPICMNEQEALDKLRDVADAFLVHNRPIRRRADDSIVRVVLGRQQILRRARGYAPLPVAVKGTMRPTLAVGGHLKNAVAFGVPGESSGQTNIYVSAHIGDLETKEALSAFQNAVDDFEHLYDIQPETVACDLHPEYLSTKYAKALQPVGVQHHFAHVASCMAENGVDSPALGVAWDGTGYGLDGTIWGGEFLAVEYSAFRRVGHFRTFPLPGGDSGIRKPGLAGLGVRFEAFGDAAFDGSEPQPVRQMLQRGFRCPRTSSVGRLFDAVASFVGLRERISFEGQAAMELEFSIDRTIGESYPFSLCGAEPIVVDWAPAVRQILREVGDGAPASAIAARFHNTLCEVIVEVAKRIRMRKVVLTGGCFQNRYLTERAVQRLEECGFQPYWHQRVPPNDGGLALGQAVIAQAMETICASQSQAG